VGGEERSRFIEEDCLRAVLNKVFCPRGKR
jgi:hypothetical protein